MRAQRTKSISLVGYKLNPGYPPEGFGYLFDLVRGCTSRRTKYLHSELKAEWASQVLRGWRPHWDPSVYLTFSPYDTSGPACLAHWLMPPRACVTEIRRHELFAVALGHGWGKLSYYTPDTSEVSSPYPAP